jgi:hypothetical protein
MECFVKKNILPVLLEELLFFDKFLLVLLRFKNICDYFYDRFNLVFIYLFYICGRYVTGRDLLLLFNFFISVYAFKNAFIVV